MNARSDSDNELLAKVATDVAVLTARFEATLPHVATKADLLGIKDEIVGARLASKNDLQGVKDEIAVARLASQANLQSVKDEIAVARLASQADLQSVKVEIAVARLASQADLQGVKDEMAGVRLYVGDVQLSVERTINARLSKMQYWLIGTVVTSAFGIGGMYASLIAHSDAQMAQLRQEMKADREQLRQEIAGLSNRIDSVLAAKTGAATTPPRR